MTGGGVPGLSVERARDLARELYGLDAEVSPLPSYQDQNFRLRTKHGDGWVLKIANSGEARGVLEAVAAALEHLADFPAVASRIPRLLATETGELLAKIESGNDRHLVHFLSYLPGKPLGATWPRTPELLASVGGLVAAFDRGLADFSHPAVHREMAWDLAIAHRVRPDTRYIPVPRRRYLAERYLDAFESEVIPRLEELPAGVIHSDPNEYNILVADDDRGAIRASGLIDFTDLVYSRRVFDLAIAAAYAILGEDDLLAAACSVVKGYHHILPLDDRELAVLFPALCARLAVSVTMSSREQRRHPDNTHITISQKPAWTAMERLAGVDPEVARKRFAQACGRSSTSAAVGRPPDEILEARRRHLGPSLSVSYRRPLKIVRGWMQYLFDEAGRAYLDGVNNVCHVGHCHPRVVAAAARQMEWLNTNTRYLHDHLAEYAERLAATLPDPLSVCYFVCSGSEANDLALRLARAYTAKRGVVTVDGNYHGHTGCLIEISPYKFDGPGGDGAPDHVRKVMMPDGFRQRYQSSDQEAGRKYADHVAAAVAQLEDSPHGVAAFFCESLLGCGGQVVPAAGYLEHAFRHVRSAGGVCVADEVQVGFGRVGSHFWAFETQGVVPDVVTLGKPIGNGHPLAAVVTTPEIAASFANGMEYFNTFGGNPVSCAVGLAVLDAIAEEGLQEHARRVGARLIAGLSSLSDQHPLIGDVRGLGLFLGVELVRDRELLTPAAEEASRVVEAMKERGILLSTDGPLHNVLKIKPPLPFADENADRLVEVLDQVLGEEAAEKGPSSPTLPTPREEGPPRS